MQKCQEVPVIRETPRQTHPGTSPGAPPTGQGSTCIDVTSFWARSSRFNVNQGAGAGGGGGNASPYCSLSLDSPWHNAHDITLLNSHLWN